MKRPKVLIFAGVAAVGTVLNTILLIVLLHSTARFARLADVVDRLAGPAEASDPSARAAEARAAEARVLTDRSNQAASRANLCKYFRRNLAPIGDFSQLSDLVEQIQVTQYEAELLLGKAAGDRTAGKFGCSPSGTVEAFRSGYSVGPVALQRDARAKLCGWAGKVGSLAMAGDTSAYLPGLALELAEQLDISRADAEALLKTANGERQADKFRCSTGGKVE